MPKTSKYRGKIGEEKRGLSGSILPFYGIFLKKF